MSRRPLLRVVVVIAAAVFAVLFLSRAPTDGPFPGDDTDSDGAVDESVPARSTSVADPPDDGPVPTEVGYVVTEESVPVSETAGDPPVTRAAAGLLFPVLEEVGGGYRVFTMCNTEAWLPADGVRPGYASTGTPGFEHAVFVIDPGHGHPDIGAVGPTGLTETEVNLDVSARIVDLLESSHDIDWETGAVTSGDDVAAAADAVMTRGPGGPAGGDFRTGLSFRAVVGNATNATALVSIHHNSSPETTLEHPGSEAFVSLSNPESPRLGGLIVEELRRSLATFDADWVGSTGSGLVNRVDPDGSDYYTVLDRAEVPAAIVEGAYISNPSEEALAMTDEFRRVYAESVYRALVRFVTTDDDPMPAPGPTIWEVDTGSVSMDGCRIPTPTGGLAPDEQGSG